MNSQRPAKYNLFPDVPLPDAVLELWAFREHHQPEAGGLGTVRHFWNFVRHVWPDLQRNEWLNRQIKSVFEDEHWVIRGDQRIKVVSWAGCGSSGKTFAAGLASMVFWLADVYNSSVVLTSTSKDMIGRRVWPVIQELYHSFKVDGKHCAEGNLVDSRKVLQAEKGDDKHSISAMAVERGETSKAVENLKGQHNRRIMLVIDEATGTPEAIFQTIPNIRKACSELIILIIGNPMSKIDCHGRCCEPKGGWHSITHKQTSWETKGVPDWQLEAGICHHFPGWDSPNVKARKTVFPFIYTWEDHLAALERQVDTLSYWHFDEGFWAPDGTTNTVFNLSLIEQYDMRGKHTWKSRVRKLGALDTAFGGDEMVFLIGEMGDLMDSRVGLQILRKVPIKIEAIGDKEVDYQIAHQVIDICRKEGIAPEAFGLDATGIGRGVAAIVATEWSSAIVKVEFGGAPSERPVSETDGRPCKDAYDRRVSELWYQAREMGTAGLLKGLYHEAIIQLCNREYTYKAKKISIEPKEDVKAKLNRSPDDADAVAILVEVARTLGMESRKGAAPAVTRDWQKLLEQSADLYDSGVNDNGYAVSLEHAVYLSDA